MVFEVSLPWWLAGFAAAVVALIVVAVWRAVAEAAGRATGSEQRRHGQAEGSSRVSYRPRRPPNRRDTLLPLSHSSHFMNLSAIRARVHRLRDLAHGMGKEVALWKAQEGPLLPLERKQYLEAVRAGAAAVAASTCCCCRPPTPVVARMTGLPNGKRMAIGQEKSSPHVRSVPGFSITE